MSILSSLWKVIKKIVSTIVKFIMKIIKKFWWVILIIACIYFLGPYLLTYMSSVGAPAWLTTLATTVVNGVSSGLTWVGSLFMSGWSSLSTAAAGWSLQTWATIAGSAAMLLAPEETGDLLGEIGGAIIDVGAGLLSGGLGTWLLVGVAAYVGYRWLTKDDNDTTIQMETS